MSFYDAFRGEIRRAEVPLLPFGCSDEPAQRQLAEALKGRSYATYRWDGQSDNVRIPIDANRDGYDDELIFWYAQGEIHAGRLTFNRFNPVPPLAIPSRDPPPLFLSGSVMESVMQKAAVFYLGDFNGDGWEDILIPFKEGLYFYWNEFAKLKPYQSRAAQDTAERLKWVPEYERKGGVRFSVPGIRHTEYQTNGTVRKGDFTALYPSAAAMPEGMPGEFSMGATRAFPGLKMSSVGGRLVAHGIRVQEDYANTWPQDLYESVLIDGKGGQLPFLGSMSSDLRVFDGTNELDFRFGGDLQPFRNGHGKLFLSVSPNMVVAMQASYMRRGQAITYAEAILALAAHLGVHPDQLAVVPRVAGFKHLDQQFLPVADGKAVAVSLSRDHPEYGLWEEAKARLRALGLDFIHEAPVTAAQAERARSPVNMITARDSAGQLHFFIPQDPDFIYVPPENRWMRPLDGDKWEDDAVFFYDVKPPPVLTDLQKALAAYGRAHILPSNGMGGGSLHCNSNTEVE